MSSENNQPEISLSHEEHRETLWRRVFQGATTTSLIDWLKETHPEWENVSRKKIADALRTSNPRSNAFTQEWSQEYTRINSQYIAHCQKLVEAALRPASAAISAIAIKLRQQASSVSIETANDLLAASRSLVPIKKVVLDVISDVLTNGVSNDRTDQTSDSTIRDDDAERLARIYLEGDLDEALGPGSDV
ncbi:MAG: hypothetical protein OXT74_13970 [Candidatus Poribacteria bacterium]|nr:hypothetical protein [Candidatus Poribacteria bacterium]